jgi:hypothetical protein
MRIFWTGIDAGHFNAFWEAYKAKQLAISRREVLRNPAPMIVKMRKAATTSKAQ